MPETAPLEKKITEDLTAAMKRRDEAAVSVLRLLKSALKYREVELKRPLQDSDVVEVLAKQAKQRRESIEALEKASRAEAAAREKAELALVESYLPRQLSEEEIAAAVEDAVARTGASGSRDIGKVMSDLTPKLKGRADMGKVSSLVRKRLS